MAIFALPGIQVQVKIPQQLARFGIFHFILLKKKGPQALQVLNIKTCCSSTKLKCQRLSLHPHARHLPCVNMHAHKHIHTHIYVISTCQPHLSLSPSPTHTLLYIVLHISAKVNIKGHSPM